MEGNVDLLSAEIDGCGGVFSAAPAVMFGPAELVDPPEIEAKPANVLPAPKVVGF